MIDFEFEFQYAEEKQPALQKIGGSGCGKSTLLRCLNGLIPQFYEGELKGFCRLNGQDTAGMRIGEIGELTASVFQDPRSQFFTVNSSNEVAFGLKNHGLPQNEIRQRQDHPLQSDGAVLGCAVRQRAPRRTGCSGIQLRQLDSQLLLRVPEGLSFLGHHRQQHSLWQA